MNQVKPWTLPEAEVADDAVIVQFENLRPYIPELIDELREELWRNQLQ